MRAYSSIDVGDASQKTHQITNFAQEVGLEIYMQVELNTL
jgi:hypothetical protein